MDVRDNLALTPYSLLVLRVSPVALATVPSLILIYNTVKILINEKTGVRELHVPGTLVSINPEVRKTQPNEATDYAGGTKYQWCKASFIYPGEEQPTVIDATIWSKSITSEKNEGKFEQGSDISLVTALEGPGTGLSKVGLPTSIRMDLSKFDLATVEEPTETI